MISPMTPPGEKVVFLGPDVPNEYVKMGDVCTLSIIEPTVAYCDDCGPVRFGCEIVEAPYDEHEKYCLCQFRRLELPRSLIECLNAAPVDEKEPAL
jgi:hypothetical protein